MAVYFSALTFLKFWTLGWSGFIPSCSLKSFYFMKTWKKRKKVKHISISYCQFPNRENNIFIRTRNDIIRLQMKRWSRNKVGRFLKNILNQTLAETDLDIRNGAWTARLNVRWVIATFLSFFDALLQNILTYPWATNVG